jgi:hypothetical protein
MDDLCGNFDADTNKDNVGVSATIGRELLPNGRPGFAMYGRILFL